ncbi:hypothetical protein HBI81_230190 [Parastagonospora nodorum]|nr:hypothetical protein HBH51_242280 [Parastagonospora nodorum]KAH4355287.1 hypothetical protein HBH97_238400 [Parastagonospora nodorum]KAH4368782.1 hypothetical protein HBH99_244430 [Parastagonospora nodorum]KAH5394456.1 hypothetical protein HBI47_240590 [Parastagonospora nodorum]KAH6512337.1 hypothetical protein HBI81_230190 [Parastagonospora nodorum]
MFNALQFTPRLRQITRIFSPLSDRSINIHEVVSSAKVDAIRIQACENRSRAIVIKSTIEHVEALAFQEQPDDFMVVSGQPAVEHSFRDT